MDLPQSLTLKQVFDQAPPPACTRPERPAKGDTCNRRHGRQRRRIRQPHRGGTSSRLRCSRSLPGLFFGVEKPGKGTHLHRSNAAISADGIPGDPATAPHGAPDERLPATRCSVGGLRGRNTVNGSAECALLWMGTT